MKTKNIFILITTFSVMFLYEIYISAQQQQQFEVIWEINLPGWKQMPIIKNNKVYFACPEEGIGGLGIVDLYTGQVLGYAQVGMTATAPFIVGNYIYTYDRDNMHEVDLNTLQVVRNIIIENSCYTENIPYDEETGYFFVRQAVDYKGRLTAYRLSDAQIMWSFPQNYEGGFDNHQAPIVVGDSVFFQATNAYWQGKSVFYRINKRTGQLIWETELGPAVNANGGMNRGGYNNPIYDEDHDVFYVSESWNKDSTTGLKGNCRFYSIRRDNGQILWYVDVSSRNIESTLTYYDNVLYVPLHVDGGVGSYRAVDVSSGTTIWEQTGFFNEDCWSATAVCDRYLYRTAHGDQSSKLIIQDKKTGDLVWAYDAGGDRGCCCNPVQSDGIVVLGSTDTLFAIKVGDGDNVDSDWHGYYHTGYNPGAIIWYSSVTTPVKLSLYASPKKIFADGVSVTTITARVFDANNNLVLNSNPYIYFSITGAGELLGSTTVQAVNGIAKIVFKSSTTYGTAVITATASGLQQGTANIVLMSTGSYNPRPIISVSTRMIDFNKLGLKQTISTTFNITNVGQSTLYGTITDNADWLTVDPTTFSSNTVTVRVTADNNILNKGEGQYSGIITIDSNGGLVTIDVVLTATCILTAPNPYTPEKGLLTFFGSGIVPGKTTIKIYTLSGELVKTLYSSIIPVQTGIQEINSQFRENNKLTEITWDGKNEVGDVVVSGIYLYVYESPKEKGIGKFTVIDR